MFIQTPNGLTPIEVIEIFKNTAESGWIKGDDDDDASYGMKTHLLISLWPHSQGFELRYGYQGVAIVSGPGGVVTKILEG